MKRKSFFAGIGASLGMLILILDGKTAMAGARDGLDLCLKTVIPSLFPFFLLSGLLTSAFAGRNLSLLRPMAALCGVPEGGESLLLTGFLGGYPVGAQSVADLFRSGQLSKAEAERMLAFCNNAGPAFLFGMAASLFSQRKTVFLLWQIHMMSAVFTAMLIPSGTSRKVTLPEGKPVTISDAMHRAVPAMAYVCGWVVLFRVLIAFLNRWVLWLLPVPVQVGIAGLLELTNGCCSLASVTHESLRFILCSGMLAAGGLCVTMQTLSVTDGLSLKLYFLGKGLQVLFSLVLSTAWAVGIFLPVLIATGGFAFLLRKNQKSYSIQPAAGV